MSIKISYVCIWNRNIQSMREIVVTQTKHEHAYAYVCEYLV